jgi:hypothetical protein
MTIAISIIFLPQIAYPKWTNFFGPVETLNTQRMNWINKYPQNMMTPISISFFISHPTRTIYAQDNNPGRLCENGWSSTAQ